MQGGKGLDWGYLVLMDRLDDRCDNIRDPESSWKDQFARKKAKEGLVLGLEISACWT